MNSITTVLWPAGLTLTPEVPYRTLENLIPDKSRRWYFYPDPTFVLVPLAYFSKQGRTNLKKLPRGLNRPDGVRYFDLEILEHPELRHFRSFVSPGGEDPNWHVLARIAAEYGEICLAFHSAPTKDKDIRRLGLVARIVPNAGYFPLFFNAKQSDKLLKPDSLIGHTDLTYSGETIAQIVKSPGNFLDWSALFET